MKASLTATLLFFPIVQMQAQTHVRSLGALGDGVADATAVLENAADTEPSDSQRMIRATISTHEKETWYLDPTSSPENRNSRGDAEVTDGTSLFTGICISQRLRASA